jgi:chitinase
MPNFVKNLLDYVEEYNLDGIDVDIEGNLLPYIGNTYTPFVLELKDACMPEGRALPVLWELHICMKQ